MSAKATCKAKLPSSALWGRSHPLPGLLVTFYRPAQGRKQLTVETAGKIYAEPQAQAKREKEPWLLVVSKSLKAYTAVRVVNYYRARMQIEEGFHDRHQEHSL